jgi:osmotically-inducible protein OsmY
MKKGLLCLLCLALALCVLQGCKVVRPAATHEPVADSAIASEVRGRIAEEGLPPVRVFVLEGRVTLSGSVPSQEIKEKIITLAKSVEGVLLVVPDLQLQKIR